MAAGDEGLYRIFFENSNIGIWRYELDTPMPVNLSVDAQVQYAFDHAFLAEANPAMAMMYGYDSVAPLIGTRLTDLMLPDDPRNIEFLRAFVESGYKLSGVDSHEKDKQGNDKYFRNSLVGEVRDGHVVCAWGTQQDITEQQVVVDALRKSEERLAIALKASRVGIWEWDIVHDALTWSDELKTLYGLKPADEITYERYQSLLHPDCRDELRRHVEDTLQTGRGYEVEHRIVWPDGSEHWTLGRGQAILQDGKAVRMVGTAINIDDIRHSQELQLANETLRSQRSQLLALNNSKDEFISLASHQLRTPATGVKQYIGMLLEGYAGELADDQVELLRVAYESNERQLQIIDDLLKVAHVDAGKVQLRTEMTDLAQLVEDVVKEQRDTFRRRHQRVIFELPDKPVCVEIDRARIRMVVENLIDNAGKYSPEGRNVTVVIRPRQREASIAIIDRGVGIPKEHLGKLFQKFSRVSNPLSTLVGGTGIGLYWAKKIVDLHGGKITVSSRPDEGSTFTIILPKHSRVRVERS